MRLPLLRRPVPQEGGAAGAVEESESHPVVAGYRVGEEMGRGPLGKIYRAQHVETGDMVVFRGFTRPADADDTAWQAAKEEFRSLLEQHRRIDGHPVIQQIIAFGEEGELFWIATEYFEGRPLHEFLGGGTGGRPMDWAVAVMKQVAAAVDFAAERGLAHTDLTPSNVLLLNEAGPEPAVPRVKVINFGLAHARNKFGSPYAAPEQVTGKEGDRRSDVWGAGALLFHLLTGALPFVGDSPKGIAGQILQGAPPIPGSLPEYARDVLAKMLARNPSARYPSVGAAVADLEFRRSPKVLTSFEEAAPTGRGTDDRFAATQIGGATDSGFSQPPPVGIQQYRLSEQDLVEIRQRMRREQIAKESGRASRRDLGLRLAKYAVVAILLLALGAHASRLPESYRVLRVAAVTGSPEAGVAGRLAPATPGKTYTAQKGFRLATGPSENVTLALHGASLYVGADSVLELRELRYHRRAVRRFHLRRGRAVVEVRGRRRDGVFEVSSPGSVRAIVRGTRFAVTAAPDGGPGRARVTVASQEGVVRVVHGDHRRPVAAGQMLTLSPQSPGSGSALPAPSGLTGEAKAVLAAGETAIRTAGSGGLGQSLIVLEESVVLPVVEAAQTVARLPQFLADQKQKGVALASAQALGVLLLSADDGDSLPGRVELTTLKELGMESEDRKRILASFEGGRLVSYRPLPNGGYEFLARARDSGRTLIRGRNGAVTIVGNDDTELPDAPPAGKEEQAAPPRP